MSKCFLVYNISKTTIYCHKSAKNLDFFLDFLNFLNFICNYSCYLRKNTQIFIINLGFSWFKGWYHASVIWDIHFYCPMYESKRLRFLFVWSVQLTVLCPVRDVWPIRSWQALCGNLTCGIKKSFWNRIPTYNRL